MPLGSDEAVALAGMMGSGKTTVARLVARLLRRPVLSTDAMVEALARKPIPRIFTEEGEPAFRALERAVIGSIRGAVVVDLGGGAFCDPESAARLLRVGRVVFLDVSAAEAARRMGDGAGARSRPLGPSWRPLLSGRLPLYRRAHHRVAVDGLAPEAVARRVVDLLERGAGR